jgi:hypothetical protein
MKPTILALLTSALFSVAKAQTDSASMAPYIRAAADSMTAAFGRKDFKTFAKYNNATLVEMLGGEESFANFIDTQVSSLKDVSFNQIRAGRILRVLADAKPRQCIVEQCSEINYQGNYISVISHLVGTSDNGRDWRFADGNSDSGRDIKTLIPDISPALTIPKKKQAMGVRLEELLKTYTTAY